MLPKGHAPEPVATEPVAPVATEPAVTSKSSGPDLLFVPDSCLPRMVRRRVSASRCGGCGGLKATKIRTFVFNVCVRRKRFCQASGVPKCSRLPRGGCSRGNPRFGANRQRSQGWWSQGSNSCSCCRFWTVALRYFSLTAPSRRKGGVMGTILAYPHKHCRFWTSAPSAFQ